VLVCVTQQPRYPRGSHTHGCVAFKTEKLFIMIWVVKNWLNRSKLHWSYTLCAASESYAPKLTVALLYMMQPVDYVITMRKLSVWAASLDLLKIITPIALAQVWLFSQVQCVTNTLNVRIVMRYYPRVASLLGCYLLNYMTWVLERSTPVSLQKLKHHNSQALWFFLSLWCHSRLHIKIVMTFLVSLINHQLHHYWI
jgi:hypothetical protein